MSFRFFAGQSLALAFLVLSAAQVLAAEDNDLLLSAGQIGLVHELRWSMSIAQAKAALPDLLVSEDPGPFDPRLARIGKTTVSVSGCTLDFALKFFRDQLDDVHIQSKTGGDCHSQLERDLIARFDDSFLPAPCPNIIVRRWQTPSTTGSYDYNCVPSRAGMDLRFEERTDRNGRVAHAQSLRKNNCNVIDVEILPTDSTEDVLDPILDSDLHNLSCEIANYPVIPLRLSESGSPVLNLSIADDGTVENAALVGSPTRFTQAAVDLARKKLKFLPATRAGQRVAALRQVRITFIIAGRTESFVCMCLPVTDICKDVGWFPPSYCRPGSSTIATLAPRNRQRLSVTSTDISQGVLTVSGDMSPALKWTAGPAGTRSYVIVSEEKTIPASVDPEIFWLMYDIPSSVRSVPQGIPHDLRISVAPGAVNAILPHSHYLRASNIPGYRDGVGLGQFAQPKNLSIRLQVFALDTALDLNPLDVSRDAFINAIKGHVLAAGEITADPAK